jgi:hypothetical protein
MNQNDLIRRFYSTLPAVQEWIENTLEDSRAQAVPVIDFGFPRLGKVFPHDLLARAKVVRVTGKLPYPPISSMGLPEFQQMESMPFSGITYKDTFFVKNDLVHSESLHFHELVHVVQWDQLGINDFLLAYGVGLMQFGYRDSPLEKMAYALQVCFDNQNVPSGVVDLIRGETDAIWANLAPLFSRV